MACTESMLLTNRAALLSYFVGLSVKLFGIYIYSFCFDYLIIICILFGLQFSWSLPCAVLSLLVLATPLLFQYHSDTSILEHPAKDSQWVGIFQDMVLISENAVTNLAIREPVLEMLWFPFFHGSYSNLAPIHSLVEYSRKFSASKMGCDLPFQPTEPM